jgi:chromosome segregation ATPase
MRLPTTPARWATLVSGGAAAAAAFFVIGGTPGVLYAAAALVFALLVHVRLPEERADAAARAREPAPMDRSERHRGRVDTLQEELVEAQRALGELQARLTELEHERQAHITTMQILENELTATRALAAERLASPAAEDLDRLVSALAVQDRQLAALAARMHAVDGAPTSAVDAEASDAAA